MWCLTHSGFVSIASISDWTARSILSAVKSIHSISPIGTGIFFCGTSCRRMGIIRFWFPTACAISLRHISEQTECGLITNAELSVPSMAAWISCSHMVVGGMSVQSIQVSLLRRTNSLFKRWTNSLSLREYEMNTLLMSNSLSPRTNRRWRLSAKWCCPRTVGRFAAFSGSLRSLAGAHG